MSNKACKTKICICAAVFEGENLANNFKAFEEVRSVLNPTEAELTAAGIDDVIALADKAVSSLRKLNDRLVKMGVNISS